MTVAIVGVWDNLIIILVSLPKVTKAIKILFCFMKLLIH